MNRYPVVVKELPELPIGSKGVRNDNGWWTFNRESLEDLELWPEEIDSKAYQSFFEWREDKPDPVRGIIQTDMPQVTGVFVWFTPKINQTQLDKILPAINGELFTTDQIRKAFADNWSEWIHIVRSSDITEALLKELRHGNE